MWLRSAPALLFVGLGLTACGGEDNGETAPNPRPSDEIRIGEVQIDGHSVRETAETYCGGPGRLEDLARLVGLPTGTQSLDTIAMSYGETLASSDRARHTDPAAIRQAAYEGCLAGLRLRATERG